MAEYPARSERPSDSRGGGRGDSRDSRGPQKRRFTVRKKVCRFCVDKTPYIDYKDIKTLRFFVTPPHLRQLRASPARGNRRGATVQEHRAPAVLGREVNRAAAHSVRSRAQGNPAVTHQ